MSGDQATFGFTTDADFLRGALIQARRDALAGKFGPIDADRRAECEAFLAEYDKPKGE